MALPKEYISYSQIRTYQLCPKKYYYTYIEDIRLPINEKIYLGMVFHSAVEQFLKDKISGKELSRDELVILFKDWFEKRKDNQEIKWTAAEGETRKRGVAFIHHFLREIAPELDPMMVEKELQTDLPELDVKLKGVVDLIETDFSITDFKTTTAKWSKTRVRESYLQMQIYRYLFERNFGDVVTFLRFRVIYSKNYSHIKDQNVAVRASDLDTSKMFAIIKYVVTNIREGNFYKNETYNCGFCQYRDMCRGAGKS